MPATVADAVRVVRAQAGSRIDVDPDTGRVADTLGIRTSEALRLLRRAERTGLIEELKGAGWRGSSVWRAKRPSTDRDRSQRDMRDRPFTFDNVRTRLAADEFIEDVHARTWRPVLEGKTLRAHGSTFRGPLLLVIGRREGRLTSYFLDRYGNVYWRVTGNRFRRIGNVLRGP